MQVQETVENHLKSLLIKHFDPRKADSIFTEEGEVCMESMLLSLHDMSGSCTANQPFSENQLYFTRVLRGLENLEKWNASFVVIKSCMATG